MAGNYPFKEGVLKLLYKEIWHRRRIKFSMWSCLAENTFSSTWSYKGRPHLDAKNEYEIFWDITGRTCMYFRMRLQNNAVRFNMMEDKI